MPSSSVCSVNSSLLFPSFRFSRCLFYISYNCIIIITAIIIKVMFFYVHIIIIFHFECLITSSTVADSDMSIGICANIFTVEK